MSEEDQRLVERFFGHRVWNDQDINHEAMTDLAFSLRVPILNTSNPWWSYIAGIVVAPEGSILDDGLEPTDQEVELLAKWIDNYNDFWYGEAYKRAMHRFAPFDIDGSANFGYFKKRAEGQWAYRKKTWERGPHWWPLLDGEPQDLQQLLERAVTWHEPKPAKVVEVEPIYGEFGAPGRGF